jgi:hypothetical protein
VWIQIQKTIAATARNRKLAREECSKDALSRAQEQFILGIVCIFRAWATLAPKNLVPKALRVLAMCQLHVPVGLTVIGATSTTNRRIALLKA